MYLATKDDVKSLFDLYNVEVFDGQLTLEDVALDVSDMFPEMGYCLREADEDTIELGVMDRYRDYDQFRAVLLHEMVHLYQYQVLDREPNHDQSFEDSRRVIISRVGVDIKDPKWYDA